MNKQLLKKKDFVFINHKKFNKFETFEIEKINQFSCDIVNVNNNFEKIKNVSFKYLKKILN